MQYGRLSLGLLAVSIFSSACNGGISDPGGANTPGGDDGNSIGNASGDGDGDSDGAGDGDGSGGPKPNKDGVCEEFGVPTSRAVPDMMIVLDRSGSMGRGVDRWTPSVNAIGTLTETFEDSVRFGLMLFPSDDLCGSGEVLVPVELKSAGAIEAALRTEIPGGGTPTSATLDVAYDEIGAGAGVTPDEQPTVKFVLLVTDGQPTCPAAEGSVDPQPNQSQAEHDLQLQQDHERTLDAIDKLAEAGVRTYVVGYDAELDPTLVNALSEFALHGGTDNYHPVQNEADLNAEFDKISGQVVSCTFALKDEPQDPRYVQVTLDGTQLNLDDPNGWSIDGTTINVRGDACETLQDGGDHALAVKVLCDIVIPE
jgi:Mg-chelatase subunit ChlD